MPTAIAIIVALLTLATIAAAVLVLRRLRTGQDAGPDVVLQRDPDGEMAVPVRGLFKGGAHNNLNPVLAITPQGLRFRILFEERWAFADLARLDAGPALFGASVEFQSRGRAAASASVATLPIPRPVLPASPASV